ncbi:HD domain-containing protein [Candidatus Lokiarchaeum ossiferum]|uniref:HD domain-containing protein n=1 Tax=Candidatus Lokiarchaeum ossiferum TaxID=2951803 RepID=UPI00352D77E6
MEIKLDQDNILVQTFQSNPELTSSIYKCINESYQILSRISSIFKDFTDHSIEHSIRVLNLCGKLIENSNVKLVPEEAYILTIASILHDIGMSIIEDKIFDFLEEDYVKSSLASYSEEPYINFLRDNHHILSYKFILKEYKQFGILDENYALAIAKVAMDHRKTQIIKDIDDFKFNLVKDGIGYPIGISYLSCILRIGDELDVSNFRTPYLIRKYFAPNNDLSRIEFEKHYSTLYVSFEDKTIEINAKCDSQEIYYELLSMTNKIKNKLSYCQKIIRNIPRINNRVYELNYNDVSSEKIEHNGFSPKPIGYSMDTKSVFKKFMNDLLYENQDVAIRECVQNAIDSCNYRSFSEDIYKPSIEIILQNEILSIKDNGLGMDEFIIKNYFSNLGASSYQKDDGEYTDGIVGQFGIGVFSYFLICDSFEVITKMSDKKFLFFNVRKDTELYFQFYEIQNEFFKDSGTIIRMKLNKKFSKLSFYHLKKKILKYFRFTNIPISISNGKSEIIVKNEGFKYYRSDFLTMYGDFSIRHKKIRFNESFLENFIIVGHTFRNKYLEGAFSFPINLSSDNTKFYIFDLFNSYINRSSIIDHIKDDFINESGIDIYQYGCFIQKIPSKLFKTNLYGRINLLTRNEITLDRNKVKLINEIDKYLLEMEIKLVECIISNLGLQINSFYIENAWENILMTFHFQNDFNFYINIPFIQKYFDKKKRSINTSFNDLESERRDIIYSPYSTKYIKMFSNIINDINNPIICIKRKLMLKDLFIHHLILNEICSILVFDNIPFISIKFNHVEGIFHIDINDIRKIIFLPFIENETIITKLDGWFYLNTNRNLVRILVPEYKNRTNLCQDILNILFKLAGKISNKDLKKINEILEDNNISDKVKNTDFLYNSENVKTYF